MLRCYQGEQGDRGDQGDDGVPGAPGLPGEPGRDGLTGLKGEKVQRTRLVESDQLCRSLFCIWQVWHSEKVAAMFFCAVPFFLSADWFDCPERSLDHDSHLLCFPRVMLVPAALLPALWWVMVQSCQAPKEREENPVPKEKANLAKMCGDCVSVYLSRRLCPSVLWELLMIIAHVFFPGKTRLTRCSGARGSQGKQGTDAHLLYYQIYKYMHRIASLSLTASHLCCPLPPPGRCWSRKCRPSRTTSKADGSF